MSHDDIGIDDEQSRWTRRPNWLPGLFVFGLPERLSVNCLIRMPRPAVRCRFLRPQIDLCACLCALRTSAVKENIANHRLRAWDNVVRAHAVGVGVKPGCETLRVTGSRLVGQALSDMPGVPVTVRLTDITNLTVTVRLPTGTDFVECAGCSGRSYTA